MIQLIRGPQPTFLQSDKIMSEKKRLEDSFHTSGRQERLRFDIDLLKDIRKDLMEMSNGKCVYCESRLGTVNSGEIENFRPKAGARGFNNEYAAHHYWWLAYEWENLFIACQTCNQKFKRDLFPLEDETKRARIGAMGSELLEEKPLLINPCIDNPEEHLEFISDGTVQPLTDRGKATIEVLGLNREHLVSRRNEAAKSLMTRLNVLPHNQSIDFARTFGNDILNDVNEFQSYYTKQEYAAVLRNAFDDWFEKNVTVWENIKRKNEDSSITKKSTKKKPGTADMSNAITNVEQQLSQIKRFSIKSVEIENFRSIDHAFFSLLPVNEKDSREAWLLLLGDNGIGKSSILQAIALALAGKKQLAKLDLDVTDFLKRGKQNGKVIIKSYEHNKPVELYFDKQGFTTDLEDALTFILAYGSTRLLPKGNIQPDHNKEPYLNIRNLFDYSIALTDPNEWLKNISHEEFEQKVAPAFFDLLALRGNDKVWLNNGKISIQQYGDDHELEDNSDGYKTVVALVTDMMQTLSVDNANYHNSQGIVLIDEIGNHLHPRWRMKIVSALRKAFPRLQFIVTTHEPLCLRGLSHGEVVVLVRDQLNMIRALDKDLLPDHSLMRIEQLLTSDLFGLINVMDEETEKTYEEYYKLLSKKEEDKSEEDKNKIKEITEQLTGKEVLGSTPVEQAYYQLLSETSAKKIREEGFKTKEKLKQETVDEVKQMLKNKKLNWL